MKPSREGPSSWGDLPGLHAFISNLGMADRGSALLRWLSRYLAAALASEATAAEPSPGGHLSGVSSISCRFEAASAHGWAETITTALPPPCGRCPERVWFSHRAPAAFRRKP